MQFRATLAIITLTVSPTMVVGAEFDNWEGEGEAGVLVTSGNTEETNINGRLGLLHEVSDRKSVV